jgi:hypothetical protein
MDYSTFEASFIKKNKLLWISLIASLILSSLSLSAILTSKSYFLSTNGEVFKERPLIEDICFMSFNSITSNNLHNSLIADDIINILEKEPFILKVSKYLKIKSIDQNKCQVIVKTNGKVRSFKLGMIADDSYPFHYKLYELDEVELNEDETEQREVI